jgi:hypothetical protein
VTESWKKEPLATKISSPVIVTLRYISSLREECSKSVKFERFS